MVSASTSSSQPRLATAPQDHPREVQRAMNSTTESAFKAPLPLAVQACSVPRRVPAAPNGRVRAEKPRILAVSTIIRRFAPPLGGRIGLPTGQAGERHWRRVPSERRTSLRIPWEHGGFRVHQFPATSTRHRAPEARWFPRSLSPQATPLGNRVRGMQ